MIEVTDLMVGDWVQNPHGYKAQVLDIHYIKDEGDGYGGGYRIHMGKSNWGVVQWVEEKDIEPIPLTPEILERNGFTKENRLYYWLQEKDGKTTAGAYYWVDEQYISIAGYEDDGVTISCPYIHTLQHALKLCGINKEITL